MEAELSSEAHIRTPMAQRYMTQLCKHFEHRLSVSYSADQGSIAFPVGLCRLAAAGDVLVLRAAAPDETQLGALEGVVARHLERFAFRDKPVIAWRRLP